MQVDGLADDPERLLQAAKILQSEVTRLTKLNLEQRNRIAELEGKDPASLQLQIAELEQQLAAERSEKRPKAAGAARDKAPQTGHGPSEQAELEHIEELCTLDEADQSCPKCGGELGAWDGQFGQAEVVDVITRKFVLRQIKRQKYRCACCTHIETALHDEPRLTPGGRYSNTFAVEVAVDKYADHLPLERQVRRMRREGLDVSSQALWDQIAALAKALEPAYEKLKAFVLSQGVIGADETHWRLLGKGKKRWWVWALCSEEAVYYELAESRSGQQAASLFRSYEGIAITDGYAAYKACKKQNPSLRIAHCWSHVRRKFVECEEQHPDECKKVLDLIAELYAIEKDVRGSPPEQIQARRQSESKPITQQILQASADVRALPGSPIRKAFEYMHKLWDGLTIFLSDPAVPLDNNGTERALRGVVLGRKNHYGSKSERGTKVAAILYSLIESAKLAGVEPREYLLHAAREALDGRDVPLPREHASAD